MLTYREFGAGYLLEVQEIYAACGRTSHLGDEEKLWKALGRSLPLLGAFEDGVLVGFVRRAGDGEHTLYVQNSIVRPVLRGKGIGWEFVRQVPEYFAGVWQFLLTTDAEDAASNAFHRAIGLKTVLGGYPRTVYHRGLPEV